MTPAHTVPYRLLALHTRIFFFYKIKSNYIRSYNHSRVM